MTVLLWSIIAAMSGLAVLLLLVPLTARAHSLRQTFWACVPAVFLPALAIGGYLFWGTPSAATHNPANSARTAAPRAAPVAPASTGSPSVGSLLNGLEKRLKRNPADPGGWLLLAKSYHHLGRPDKAVDAYRQAVMLGAQDKLLAGQLDWRAGVVAAQPTDSLPSVVGTVRLDPALAHLIEPKDTVFVLAKAVDGPPMPLAVMRAQASDMPLDFALHDGLAMLATHRLSDFQRVTVMARISKSGDATAQPGDLTSQSVEIAVDDSTTLVPVQLIVAAPL